MAKKREPSMADYASKRNKQVATERMARAAPKASAADESKTPASKKARGGKGKKPGKRSKTQTAPAIPMPAGSAKEFHVHEPRYDLETLTRAEEIKRDAKRHAAAQQEARRQQDRLASITAEKSKATPA